MNIVNVLGIFWTKKTRNENKRKYLSKHNVEQSGRENLKTVIKSQC